MSFDVVKYILEEKKRQKKKTRIIFSIIGGLFLLIVVAGSLIDEPTNKPEVAAVSDRETNDPRYEFIPGLAPVDVYLSLEQQGFSTDKRLSSEHGNFWESKQIVEGIEYRVTTFSRALEKVETVQATALIDLGMKQIEAAQPFLLYIVSIPYEGSKPEKVQKWIRENFYNDKASLVVNGVKFTIYAPSLAMRMINVEKS